jgi:hypothetical protein
MTEEEEVEKKNRSNPRLPERDALMSAMPPSDCSKYCTAYPPALENTTIHKNTPLMRCRAFFLAFLIMLVDSEFRV